MYSDSLISIVTLMLKKNPDDRPTADDILQDPFIKKHIARLIEKTAKEYVKKENFRNLIDI